MSKLILILAVFFTSLTSIGAVTNIHLTADNSITLRNEVSSESITQLQKGLNDLVNRRGTKTYPIYLVLDSPGGSIDAGLSFIEYAKTIPNLETITLFSASMAAGIVEALPGKRHIIETGVLMFHRARGGVDGQFEDGELESRLQFYKKVVRLMEVNNASRMSLSLDSYKAKVKDELWILGSEAVNLKAADSVVTVTCSQQLLNQSKIESFIILGMFQVNVSFSGCPTLRFGEVLDNKMKATYNKYRTNKWSIGTSTTK